MKLPEELEKLLAKAAEDETALPPVHKWQPEHEADVDIRIARDGQWFYQESPIERHRMVKLFSTILLREGDDHFLVTPVEKLRIQVEDAPFVAIDVQRLNDGDGDKLIFQTNVDSHVVAGPSHPIRVEVDEKTGEPSPYVCVRDNLDALISRNAFYQLVEWASREGDRLVIESDGEKFELGRL